MRSMSTEGAVDTVVFEARVDPERPRARETARAAQPESHALGAPRPGRVVARAAPPVPDFDEFSAPEGAFGRFRYDLQLGGVDPDEHTRFVC